MPRAIVLSLCIFAIVLCLVNTVPVVVLRGSLCQKAEKEISTRAEQIAAGSTAEALDSERIILLDNEARVTYDSDTEDSMVGKVLYIPAVRKAHSKAPEAQAQFAEEIMISHTVVPRDGGYVYIFSRDKEAEITVDKLKETLWFVSLALGILFVFAMIIGAYHIKKRIKVLISGVSAREYTGPITVSGNDEIAELAEMLNKLSAQMIETEELRRTFVSDASHELRTPLSSIQLLVDSIVQTENIDVATTKEFMADISEQIERLTRIAERLLILTNLDGAKILALEPVDMKKVATSVISTLEQTAHEAKVELVCNFAEDVIFRGTPDGAYQIIFNLVENAIKYNRPGGVVRVYIYKNDDECLLIVDDNGIGIPEEDFELIFERFYRVDKARSRKDKGGNGLGLAIVKKNVENYNGKIKVEPSVDGGTRFTVTFPQEGTL